MFCTIGKCLNSLKYHVDKHINETLYKNPVFLSSKWNWLEHCILRLSQRYRYYIFLTIILACVLTVNLLFWKADLTPLAIKYFPYWKALIDWQGIFLASQLTIVAIVYPLVIGLISTLFQNKSAKKVLLPIYQTYSGFIFSGLSGLTLSIFIIVGYLFRGGMEESSYLAICITTSLWLIFNLMLTCWFFTTTFLILDEMKRDRLIIRFTIHELCENDIRRRIRELLLLNAIQNKILVNPNEEILQVSTFSFSEEAYEEIIHHSTSPSYVSNAYFAILNAVINYHARKINLDNKRKSLGTTTGSKIKPKIIIQSTWSKKNKPGLIVIKYSGFEMGTLSKALLKASFRTKKFIEYNHEGLNSMIVGIVSSANDSIREKNTPEFKIALRNIEKWHVEITSALSFLNNKQEDDNWLQLPVDNLGSRNYFDAILTEYYQMAKAAVEAVSESIEFFNEIIYLHRRIFTSQDKSTRHEGVALIKGNYLIWSLLMEWYSYSSSSPDKRIANKYEDVLFDFVGAWESWLYFIDLRKKQSNDIHAFLPLYLAHLEYTAHTVIIALRYDNIEATGWGVDMLNNWMNKLLTGNNRYFFEEYHWYSELITHPMLFKDANVPAWINVLNGNEFDFQAAFSIAMNNAVFDLRVITTCYILLKPKLDGDDERIKQYINALLSGAPIYSSDSSIEQTKAIVNASDILGAYIRHRDYPNHGYNSWLSGILSSFGRLNDQRMISGRIYSGWGHYDPYSMKNAYVEITLAFSQNQWQLNHKWFDILFSDAFRYQDQESLIRELKEWLSSSDEINESCLISKEDLNTNRENFKVSIQQIIDQINLRQDTIIANAEIDDELLTKFGLISSEAITSMKKIQIFPINLFQSVDFKGSSGGEKEYKIRVNKYFKKDVAKNIKTNRAINEKDFLKKTVKDNIKINMLKNILSYPITNSKIYANPENNILALAELAKTMDDPILLLGNTKLSDLLHKARYQQDLASKFNISFMAGYEDDYICHLGNIIVFSTYYFSNVDFSLLITKALFQSVEFSKVADKQFVEVDYIPSQENENIGVLSLSYRMNIQLQKELPCIQMSIRANDEE